MQRPDADGGALPIRIPGFGTSPQSQSFLLGTPPASLASLGGEPYFVNNSPSVGGGLMSGTTLAAPQASWPRPAFAEGQAGKPKKEAVMKPKNQQRLTFQDSKEQPIGQLPKGKATTEVRPLLWGKRKCQHLLFLFQKTPFQSFWGILSAFFVCSANNFHIFLLPWTGWRFREVFGWWQAFPSASFCP